MPLLPAGTRLGPYEVLGSLGEGGMGEVYRARDGRLGREVAIKVLPDGLTRDTDALRRFEEEARALSALSHPSIVTVHEVGQDAGLRYIVMELVAGESLRQRLAAGPLGTRDLVRIGSQVAAGLAAAHAKGIVHRDLKPENVMVTREGLVKLLDFGLARRQGPLCDPSRPGDTVGLRPQATLPGLVVGTVAYMSPEQVRGEVVDHRSDLFAFGTLVHELVTGTSPFRRGSPAETMAAVLSDEPPDLAAVAPGVPPGVSRIVRRCLEKRPELRFQSAEDLAFALEALTTSQAAPVAAAAPARPRASRRVVLGALSLGAVAAATAFVAYQAGQRLARPAPPSFLRVTFSRGAIRSARFAQDGRTVVYGAAWNGDPIRLFSTQPESPESLRLEVADADILSVSPRGELALSLGRRFLLLHLGVGTLARGPLAGRAPRELLEDVQEADWAPDGETLAVVRDVDGRSRLEMPAGHVLYETAGWIGSPRVSPRGDLVAFVDHPLRWDDRGAVAVVDRGSTKRTLSRTWQSAGGVAFGPQGREIWFTGAPAGAGRALHAVGLDGRERTLLAVSGNLTLQDVSRTGRVLVSDDKWRRRVFARLPGAERDTELTWLDWSYPRGLSADFSRLLFDEGGDGGGKDYAIYLRTTAGGAAVQLGRGNGLALSPDGRWALTATLETPAQLVLLPTGAGAPRRLTSGSLDHRVAAFFPDGLRILFAGAEPGRGVRLFSQDLAGATPRPVSPEGIGFADNVPLPIAPDGRSVLAATPDGSVVVFPLDGGPPRPPVGLLAGERPLGWGADSRSLYAFRPGEQPARIALVDQSTGARRPFREVLPPDPAGTAAINPILVKPDGTAYVYGTPQILSDLYVVDGIR